jgi:hypothetical protein
LWIEALGNHELRCRGRDLVDVREPGYGGGVEPDAPQKSSAAATTRSTAA